MRLVLANGLPLSERLLVDCFDPVSRPAPDALSAQTAAGRMFGVGRDPIEILGRSPAHVLTQTRTATAERRLGRIGPHCVRLLS